MKQLNIAGMPRMSSVTIFQPDQFVLSTIYYSNLTFLVALKPHHTLSSLFRKPKDVINFEQKVFWCIKFLVGIAMLCM